MTQEDVRAEVARAVLRFIAGAVLHNQAVSARLGLGASDAQVLSILNVSGPMTAGRIASLTGLSTGSVTALLDRLEHGGYIQRERDAKDRRKVLVTPAPAGLARLAEHYTEYGEHLDAVLAERDQQELEIIARFLHAMNDVEGGYIRRPTAGSHGRGGD